MDNPTSSIDGDNLGEHDTTHATLPTGVPYVAPRNFRLKERFGFPLSGTLVLLVLIVLLGTGLRFFGINWDQGQSLHPDERHVVGLVQSIAMPSSYAQFYSSADPSGPTACTTCSPLNPHDFAYGSLPIYLEAGALSITTYAYATLNALSPPLDVVVALLFLMGSYLLVRLAVLRQRWFALPAAITGAGFVLTAWAMLPTALDLTKPFIVGRAVSALAGVGTIVVVYLIAERLYERRTALLAAAFFALCVLDIQLSHFLTVDGIATFFALVAVYWFVRVAQDGLPIDYLTAGAWTGAALACKVSVASLVVPLVIAPFLTSMSKSDRLTNNESRQSTFHPARYLLLIALTIFGALQLGTLASPVPFGVMPAGYPSGALMSSLVVVLLILTIAVVAWLALAERGLLQPPSSLAWKFVLIGMSIVTLLAILFLTQPYALIDMGKYITDVMSQEQLATGQEHVFYTDKFYNTPKFWYHIEHIVPWDLGWPLGLAAVLGIVVATARSIARKYVGELVLVLSTAAYFLATGGQFMKYVRYMLPIMPALCIFGAAMLLPVGTWLAEGIHVRIGKKRRWLIVGVLGLTALYALAYDNIYAATNTRITASAWFASHILPGLPFTVENGDESIAGGSIGQIGTAASGGIPQDTAAFWYQGQGPSSPPMAQLLTNAKYVTIFSDRIMGTVPHIPQAFPYSYRYYCLLFGPTPPAGFNCSVINAAYRASTINPSPYPLGFQLLKSFSNHPNLFGFSLNDYSADQNFSEYDHPPVWVFQRVRPITLAQTTALIGNGPDPSPTIANGVVQALSITKPLMLTSDELQANSRGPAFAARFPADSLPMQWPIPVWIVELEILGVLTLPIAMRLFGGLPDRGVVISKLLGLLVVGYVTWLASSLHIAQFDSPMIVISMVLVGLASLAWGVRLSDVRKLVWRNKKLWMAAEFIFLLGFAVDVVVRMIYPDLYHSQNPGEKGLDMSYLNSLVRSETMPPADPWFSGGYLNYYYYGQFLVATLSKLTGISPAVAVNLAIPTLFGFILTIAFSIGLALTTWRRFGILAAIFAVVMGNLYVASQLVPLLIALSPVHGHIPLVSGVQDTVLGLWNGVVNGVIRHQPLYVLLNGSTQLLDLHFRGGQFSWGWDATRVLSDGSINEFPFFTVLYADLHAHLMDMPIFLCAIAVGISVGRLLSGRQVDSRSPSRLPGSWVVVGLLSAIVIGACGPTNSWDLPTAFVIFVVTVLIGCRFRHASNVGRVSLAIAVIIPTGIACYALYMPYYSHFQSFYTSVTFAISDTDPWRFLLMWGIFFFAIGSFLIHDLWIGLVKTDVQTAQFLLYYWPRRRKVFGLLRAVRGHSKGVNGTFSYEALAVSVAVLVFAFLGIQWPIAILFAAMVAVGVALVVRQPAESRRTNYVTTAVGLLIILLSLLFVNVAWTEIQLTRSTGDYWTLAIVFSLLALAIASLLQGRHPATDNEGRRFVTLGLIIIALMLVAGCELASLAGDRMNTVFKVYVQAWLILALASAAAVGQLLPVKSPRLDSSPNVMSTSTQWRRIWTWAMALLVIGGVLYPVIETPLRAADRTYGNWLWDKTQNKELANNKLGLTLDGTAFLSHAFPYEYAALTWLNQTVKGDPTVLTSPHGYYGQFGFDVQWMTGLPTMVQWASEQSQQRYPDQVSARVSDADSIYSTTDQTVALELLHRYNVTYVFVGIPEVGQSGPLPASGCFAYNSPYAATQQCVGYPPAGLAKFDAMKTAKLLGLVYSNPDVKIYKVIR